MNKHKQAKLQMVKKVIDHCEASASLVSTIGALQPALNALKAKAAQLEQQAQNAGLRGAGVAGDKRSLKSALCQIAVDLAGLIYAYAAAGANETLKAEVNFSVSQLKRKPDLDLILICSQIHARAAENEETLKSYGVTRETLAELQTAIEDFAVAAPQPRTTIGIRKSRIEREKRLLRELDDILNDQLDHLVGKFRNVQPDFYETYFGLRRIFEPQCAVVAASFQNTPTAASANGGNRSKSTTIEMFKPRKSVRPDFSGKYVIKLV